MSTFVTPKGTIIDLIKLQKKDYMLVAHRLLWMNEEVKSFTINSDYLKLEDTYAVCHSTVTFYDESGKIVKQATATKKETQKDFADFVEKAESSSIGRALSMLGFGTAQSIADFDEGTRLADAPLDAPKKVTNVVKVVESTLPGAAVLLEGVAVGNQQATEATTAKVGSFRRDRKTTALSTEASEAKHAEVSNGTKGGWR